MSQFDNNNLLLQYSQRLGLPDNVLKKSEELHRVLLNKDVVRSISSVTKAVLCLDLAASITGEIFDKNDAIKYSGLKKAAYQNSYNIIEKLLELEKLPTIAELCVKFSCTVVRTLAEDILDRYQIYHVELDFKHPQYVAAALYTACKLQSIKVQRADFIAISKLKAGQWKEMEADFMKFADANGFTASKNNDKSSKGFYNFLDHISNEEHTKSPSKKVDVETIEPYEVWKERILTEARQKIAERNQQE